jgi:hypothetical protein
MPGIVEKAMNLLRGKTNSDEVLFKLLKKIWEKSENKSAFVDRMFAYY